MKIIIIDSIKVHRDFLLNNLGSAGHEVFAAESLQAASKWLTSRRFDVCLSGLRDPGMDGIGLFKSIRRFQPEATVMLMATQETITAAVEATKHGVYDYLIEPFRLDELLFLLQRVESYRFALAENSQLRESLQSRYVVQKIVSKSPAMQNVVRRLQVVARNDAVVLLVGDHDTGKERVAKTIHYNSRHRNDPFIKFDCTRLPIQALQGEFLRPEYHARRGRMSGWVRSDFETGSIFLAEVDSLPSQAQVKLLGLLEMRCLNGVSRKPGPRFNMRIIAATRADLRKSVAAGKFRADLGNKLMDRTIKLPPLQQRKEDIETLVEFFLSDFHKKKLPAIDGQALASLIDYPWPGNVRELKNVIERLNLSCQCDPILPACLPLEINLQTRSRDSDFWRCPGAKSLAQEVAFFEIGLIREALRKSGGNKTKTAALLRLPISTLNGKMRRYGIA